MSHQDPNRPNAERAYLRRNPDISAKYLARTRAVRAARRPAANVGPAFFIVILALIGATAALAMFGAA